MLAGLLCLCGEYADKHKTIECKVSLFSCLCTPIEAVVWLLVWECGEGGMEE